MAGLQLVHDTLKAAINAAIPSTFRGKLYAGWTSQGDLQAIAASAADPLTNYSHISIYGLPGIRQTTRFPRGPLQLTLTRNLSAAVAGNVATFTGSPDVGGNIAVTINQAAPIIYTQVAADTTLALVASKVATAVNAAVLPGISATAAGTTVTIAGTPAPKIAVKCGGTGTQITLLRMQEKNFMVTVWAPDPISRETLATAIDDSLGTVDRLPIANDWPLRILRVDDFQEEPQRELQVFRRSLTYSVEWATTAVNSAVQGVAVSIPFVQF